MKGSTEVWLIRLSAILWFLLLVGMLLSLPILFDVGGWAVLGLAVLAGILALPVAWSLRRLFSRQRSQPWRASLLKTALATFALLSILAATPIYFLAFNAALRPATVPLATLSNGKKTVVFQGMMHIGTESFYKGVVYDLERALTEGYVLFYEGVQPDPSADAWFSQTLAGGGDLSANYTALGKACGLDFQLNYFTLLDVDKAAHPERHVTADVTTGDMKREYERLVRTDPAFAALRPLGGGEEGRGVGLQYSQGPGMAGPRHARPAGSHWNGVPWRPQHRHRQRRRKRSDQQGRARLSQSRTGGADRSEPREQDLCHLWRRPPARIVARPEGP
jgi:hypothetical protein